MKNKLLASLIALAIAAPAMAQNSVTLYGVIDEGFDYTNNVTGSKVYELQSGFAQ
jgi:predicted porin